ncbi:LanC-like protein 2, partial [Chelonia mydas]
FTRRIQSKIKDLLQQMEEGLKTADPHDCSAYTGWTGIALLYLQLYRVTKDQKFLQRSLDYAKRILRNLNGRRVTFLCGDAGPLAVGAVVYHKLKIDSESKECITKLLQLQRTVISTDSELPDELLYGRAGYLYALLYLNTEIGPDTVPQSVIKETFKEDKYLKDAMDCSDVIWQRGLLRKGYGICHGTAGNGYSFLSLYHLTEDKKYLYRACKFAEWCLEYGAHGCRIPDRPYSLFEGTGPRSSQWLRFAVPSQWELQEAAASISLQPAASLSSHRPRMVNHGHWELWGPMPADGQSWQNVLRPPVRLP